MDENLVNSITSKLKGLLLLKKASDTTSHTLAMLGLTSIAFPRIPEITVAWDADGISVLSASIEPQCTCSDNPGGSKTYKVRNDPNLHVHECNLSMWDKLITHSCLTDVEVSGSTTTWNFQWPRDLTKFKYQIQAIFRELENEVLWENFRKSWAGIVGLMPDAKPSIFEKIIAEEEGMDEEGEDVEVAEAEDAGPMVQTSAEGEQESFDFGDDLGLVPVDQVKPSDLLSLLPAGDPASTDGGETLGVDQEMESEIAPDTTGVAAEPEPGPTPNTPATPDREAPKRKRGRPAGSTKAAKESTMTGGSTKPETGATGKKTIPACVKFADIATEELNRLLGVVGTIGDSESFPLETIRGLKNSLDRLALRAAHLEFRGAHDAGDPGAINSLIEITLANITSQMNTAVRDLSLSPEKPASWESFKKSVKEGAEHADSLFDIISQTGAGPAIKE